MEEKKQKLLLQLPGVDHLLDLAAQGPFFCGISRSVLVGSIRTVLNGLRNTIIEDGHEITDSDLSDASVLTRVKEEVSSVLAPCLVRTINATGIVVHTNLGRSLLAAEATTNLISVAQSYSNLEFDLSKGVRGSRHAIVEDILCELSGSEAAMVVNNNAAAVFICLDTLAKGKKAIVSRGELVEIGGSFRIPDVMAKSGVILKEVGTTNRTHKKDYENAIEVDTALLLKVHTSNYSIVGFTASVSLLDLVCLGKKYNILVMEDLGSGSFIDFSRYGLLKEPTIQESVKSGVDVVTFSGDKLLGGPQAGIIVGKKDIIDNIKKNPIARALRIDKLTLAALESTLHLYRDPEKAVESIPTLRMLTCPLEQIKEKADMLLNMLKDISNDICCEIVDRDSRAGGGALPLLELPSKCICVEIHGVSVNQVVTMMRLNTPPVIGRIEDNRFIMDLRTIQNHELAQIKDAFIKLMATTSNRTASK
jgi:L-seryl-tRNA(Ser) seleniumtransferase